MYKEIIYNIFDEYSLNTIYTITYNILYFINSFREICSCKIKMKFLGIDTEIVGNNDTIYYVLTKLTNLEKKFNIYIPPEYKDKFYFIIGLNHQCIHVKYENIVPFSKNKYTNLNLNITGLDELPEEYINTIFTNSYQEIFTNNNTIKSIKETIETDFPEYTDPINLETIDSYGFYFFDEENIELPNSYDSNEDSDLVYETSNSALYDEEYKTNNSIEEVVKNADDVEDNLKINKAIINCALKTNKYVKISLFLKEQTIDVISNEVNYDSTKLKYIESFLLNDITSVYHLFNVNNNLYKKKEAFNEHLTSYIESKFIANNRHSMSYLYNNYNHKDNSEFMETLLFNYTGYHFNYNDIGFIISLNHTINSNISNNESISQLSHKKFNKTRFNAIYKHDLKLSRKIDKMFNSINITLNCDLCFSTIPIRNIFYSSCYGGDLCKSCYALKDEMFQNRLTHLKKQILLCGKRELFTQQKQLIIKMLENKKLPKMTKGKRSKLLESTLKQVHMTQNKYICKVCFGELEFKIDDHPIKKNELFELNNGNTNISIGCLCGHAFHTWCINHLTNIQCPYCRQNTKFTRLFL